MLLGGVEAMGIETWTAAAIVLGVILSVITLVVTIGRPLRRLARQNDEFREDWYGVPARPGRAAIPGVPERLSRIEKELSTAATQEAIVRLETRLEDHIRSHPGTSN